jgi:hypothetical protein
MKYLTHVTFHLLYLGVSLTFLSGMTLAVEASHSQIQFVDNHLTVKVKDVSLVWLLQEIARQSGLTLEYSESLEERVTIQFHHLPFEEGLRKILRQQNFALAYVQERQEKNQSTALRPAKLWVFIKGEKAYSDRIGFVRNDRAGSPLQDVIKGITRNSKSGQFVMIAKLLGKSDNYNRGIEDDMIRTALNENGFEGKQIEKALYGIKRIVHEMKPEGEEFEMNPRLQEYLQKEVGFTDEQIELIINLAHQVAHGRKERGEAEQD